MKKKIVALASISLALTMAGCSQSNTKKIEEIDNAALFDNIAEEALINGDDFNTVFGSAMESVNSADNITISAENTVTLGEGEAADNTDYKTEVKIVKDGDTSTGSAVMDNKFNDEKSKITAYYDGAKLYFITNEGDKIGEEMGFDDFMSVVNTYSLSVFPECIDKSACIEGKNGVKEYYMSYNPVALENQMKTNLEASGQGIADGESMTVNYSNLYAKTDENGALMSYIYVLDANYSNDNEAQPYKYITHIDCTNRGKTKVDAVTDKDSYMTTEEYTQLLQERMAAEASTEEAEAEASEDGAAEEAADTAEAETTAQ